MTAADFCGEEGTENGNGTSSTEGHEQLRPSVPKLDHSILTSAISDEMPTFLHTAGVSSECSGKADLQSMTISAVRLRVYYVKMMRSVGVTAVE